MSKQIRREARFQLFPETNANDAVTSSALADLPQGDRGSFMRTLVNAGMALHRIDDRLPGLLAASLRQNTTTDELVAVLRALLPQLPAPVLTKPVEQPVKPNNLGRLMPGIKSGNEHG